MTLKTRHQKNNKKCSRKHHGKSKKKKHIKKTQRKKHSKKFYQIDGGSQNNDITIPNICQSTETSLKSQAEFEKVVFDRTVTITLPDFSEENITMNIKRAKAAFKPASQNFEDNN